MPPESVLLPSTLLFELSGESTLSVDRRVTRGRSGGTNSAAFAPAARRGVNLVQTSRNVGGMRATRWRPSK